MTITPEKKTGLIAVFLFVMSALFITVFSTSSPLYPLNPWDDANCFMTIGKAMTQGKLLYHDIFDQKGPVLFFLHYLAALVSYKSFLGVWLLEIISFFGFLWYSNKIMRLFTQTNITLPLTLLIGLFTLTTDFFFYGDSVEEFSLPVLTFTLYHILKYARLRLLPSRLTSALIGVGAALLFWMKFTILVFHFGAVVALLCVAYKRRELASVGNRLLWVFGGFLLITLLVLSFFLAQHTLYDLWDAYFYTNLFLYHGSSSNGEPEGLWFLLLKLTIWGVLVIPIAMMKVNPDVKKVVVSAYGLQMLSFTFFPVHIYYFLVCFCFSPLAVVFFRGKRFGKRTACLFLALAVAFSAKSFNLITLLNGTFQTQALHCASIVEAEKTNNEDVLTFSSHETGIYQTTDLLPPNKYFFASNLPHPDNKSQQAALVSSGQIKFLIRKIDPIKSTLLFYQAPIPDFYRLRYEGKQLFRYHFLLNPPMFLWNLGWPQPLLRRLMDGDNQEQESILLYERC